MRLKFLFAPLWVLAGLSYALDDKKTVDALTWHPSGTTPCPEPCGEHDRSDPSSWSVYHDTSVLSTCQHPILLDFHLYSALDNPQTDLTLRACSLLGDLLGEPVNASIPVTSFFNSISSEDELEMTMPQSVEINHSRAESDHGGYGALSKWMTTAKLSWWSKYSASSNTGEPLNIVTAVETIQEYLQSSQRGDKQIIFAAVKGSVVGAYLGADIDSKLASAGFLQHFLSHIQEEGIDSRMTLEVCGKENQNADRVLGIAADINGNLGWLQDVVKAWNEAQCVSDSDGSSEWDNTAVWTSEDDVQDTATDQDNSFDEARVLPATGEDNPNQMIIDKKDPSENSEDSDDKTCRITKVVSKDRCDDLARRCGIRLDKFLSYNHKKNFCTTLMPGQPVCCSKGQLPDIRPKPNKDGTCAAHTLQTGEYCQLLASKNGLTIKDIERFNKHKTWGWTSCENPQAGVRICLSKGKPPMPAPVKGAVCGPTKPGTKPPQGNHSLASLNPCPLNVCCNTWGHCGTTSEFCDITKSKSGNPGTAAKGKASCISHCGKDIVNNGSRPVSFRRLAYYEAWNMDRDCLNMHVGRLSDTYTDVHFAFGEISKDFKPVIPKALSTQWYYFTQQMTGKPFSKVLSFGGWSFSTSHDTAPIFSRSVSPENRKTFADNLVAFAKKHKLNGLDFDWEYPGAKDIPGSVPGHDGDGERYFEFLKMLRDKMPYEMTLSIAAPASYWYLRGFPIDKISKVVDYIVYMTYDLHGQWDANNKWADPGCPKGSCLRSHVNYTETYNALAMITKAGVPANKVVVGVASYGRSFKMADPSCRGPDCHFLGTATHSPAKPGRCTNTSGYIANAELQEVLNNPNVTQWQEPGTDSNYIVYDGDQWVAYMDEKTKAERTSKYRELNLGGTSDWAVDLQNFLLDGRSAHGPDGSSAPLEYLPSCGDSYDSIEEIDEAAADIPAYCAPQYVLPILRDTLLRSVDKYNSILDDDYDKWFGIYADYLVEMSSVNLATFMSEHGDEYFTCIIPEKVTCCRGCYYLHGEGAPECKYCSLPFCDKKSGGSWPGNDDYKIVNYTEPCPPDMSHRGLAWTDDGLEADSIFWTLRDDRAEAFWAAATADVGSPKDKIQFQRWTRALEGEMTDRACIVDGPWYEDCYTSYWWFNAPTVVDFHASDVLDPSDTVSKALKKTRPLSQSLWAVEMMIRDGSYEGEAADVVDAVAMPVFLIEESVKSMEKVVEIGKEIDAENRKSFILFFIMSILFVLPAAGEALAGVGLATLGRVLTGLGNLGDAGMGIYDVVQDPKSAPLVIFGLLLDAPGLMDIGKISSAARIRRGMSVESLKKLSPTVQGKLDTISKVVTKDSGMPKVCR